MNQIINKWERKFGKYAISNLTMWIIAAYAIGYTLSLVPQIFNFITLNPHAILRGQVWRLVSWVLMPPGKLGIFTVIMLFFYYSIGTTLERTWGAFRYNLYIFSGILFTVIGCFITYFVYLLMGAEGSMAGYAMGSYFSTYYINLSIFLAFAAAYPDMQVLLYFIIPVKMKWLACLDILLLGYSFFIGGAVTKVAIVASLLNFILFFFATRNYKRVSPKEIHRRKVYHQQTKQTEGVTKHKCAICGRTEKDGDDIEFRFCSKCDGNYEYCQDHLFTHEHIHRH